jgi:hypothetical protein
MEYLIEDGKVPAATSQPVQQFTCLNEEDTIQHGKDSDLVELDSGHPV